MDTNPVTSQTPAPGRYASLNGLNMYYEMRGTGQPLVLLHGGLTTIDASFGTILPSLAQTRQVIAVEQQAHGHTADIDRPLTFGQMADDTAALLRRLKLKQADIFGYSDGGNVSLGTPCGIRTWCANSWSPWLLSMITEFLDAPMPEGK